MRLFSKTTAVVILTVAAACLAAGCGKAVKYDLEPGTTLVYSIYERPGQVIEGEQVDSKRFETMQVFVQAKQRLSGRTSISLTAHPPKGESHVIFGRDLGELDFKIDSRGRREDEIGMGVPVEIRHILPELPKRLKKKDPWVEKVSVKYKGQTMDLDLVHEYQGIKTARGRRCYFIKGTAKYDMEETVNNQEMGVHADMEYHFTYEENYYIDIGRGHLAMTEVYQHRSRKVLDRFTNNVEFDEVDMDRKTIELVAVEE